MKKKKIMLNHDKSCKIIILEITNIPDVLWRTRKSDKEVVGIILS